MRKRRPLIKEWTRPDGLAAAVHRAEDRIKDLQLAPKTGDINLTQVFAGGGGASSGGGGGATDHGALTGLGDDDHPQYVQEADANYVDLTDGGATSLHSHAGGGGGTSLGLTLAVAAGAYLS